MLIAALTLGPAAAVLVMLAVTAFLYLRDDPRRAERAAHKERLRRRDAREVKLEEASVRPRELPHLTDLVATIEATAPFEAELFRLQDLLDEYANLVLASAAYARVTSRGPVRVPDCATPLRRSVRMRASSWQQMCRQRFFYCEERMATIAELVHLYAQRSAAVRTESVPDAAVVNDAIANLDAA